MSNTPSINFFRAYSQCRDPVDIGIQLISLHQVPIEHDYDVCAAIWTLLLLDSECGFLSPETREDRHRFRWKEEFRRNNEEWCKPVKHHVSVGKTESGDSFRAIVFDRQLLSQKATLATPNAIERFRTRHLILSAIPAWGIQLRILEVHPPPGGAVEYSCSLRLLPLDATRAQPTFPSLIKLIESIATPHAIATLIRERKLQLDYQRWRLLYPQQAALYPDYQIVQA